MQSIIAVGLAIAALLFLAGGCGSSTEGNPSDRVSELREAQTDREGELLLAEVERWAAEYEASHSAASHAAQARELREVERAAHACWEFGVEECKQMPKIEDIVQNLEAEADRRIAYTGRQSSP